MKNKVYVAFLKSTFVEEDNGQQVSVDNIQIYQNKNDILKKYKLEENEDDVYTLFCSEKEDKYKWLMILEREVL